MDMHFILRHSHLGVTCGNKGRESRKSLFLNKMTGDKSQKVYTQLFWSHALSFL